MNNQLTMTSSPHFRAAATTQSVMRDVLIALLPATVAGVAYFGVHALILVIACVAASVFFEYTYRKLMHMPSTVADLSAAVTGLLMALNLPANMPVWMAVIGCFAAVIIVKQLFGGIGKNFANPAIVGRIVLMISFAKAMSSWPVPNFVPDAVSSATLLSGHAEYTLSYMDMFLGRMGGSMGETCKLALIAGGIYLVARKVITITTPLAYVGTVFVMSLILGQDPVFQVLAGGLMLGAIYMATDYTTSPTTERGKLIFGIGCGLLTVVIRFYGSYAEGVSFAILIMNIVTPHIDRLTPIKAFGGAVKK